MKKLDLTMNKGIPVRIIEEINATMARNVARAEKVKGYFMNMFKKICSKYDQFLFVTFCYYSDESGMS